MRKKVDKDLQEIGKRIQKARMQSGMTQEQLAECVDVTPQYLSDLERGIVGTSISTLRKICIVLKVTSDSLLFESSSIPASESALIERIRFMPAEHRTIMVNGIMLLLDAIKADPNIKAN